MSVNQKDIVLLPFPFTNLEQSKVRPALVISNDSFNKRSDDCIMVPLTTVIKETLYSVLIDNKDLSSGNLIRQSRIRVDKVFAVEKNLVIKRIGILEDNIFKRVISEFNNMF